MKKIEGITIKKLWDIVKKDGDVRLSQRYEASAIHNHPAGYMTHNSEGFAAFVKFVGNVRRNAVNTALYCGDGQYIYLGKADGIYCIITEDYLSPVLQATPVKRYILL